MPSSSLSRGHWQCLVTFLLIPILVYVLPKRALLIPIEGVLRAPSKERPGMLLTVLQCIRQYPTLPQQRVIQPRSLSSTEVDVPVPGQYQEGNLSSLYHLAAFSNIFPTSLPSPGREGSVELIRLFYSSS